MTLSEFKAWFEGYTESLDGAPTEKQFKRIKAQVAKIDGVSITPIIYRDIYWPRVQPYFERTWSMWATSSGLNALSSGSVSSSGDVPNNGTATAAYAAAMMDDEPAVFNPSIALFAAGKADAQIDA